jgi:hypothetical protein
MSAAVPEGLAFPRERSDEWGPARHARRPGKQEPTMEIQLTRSNAPRKTTRLVIYDGGHLHSVQFLRTAFGETIPETITVSGEFAAPKPKETPAERKARLAAMSPIDKIAAAEARARKTLARIEAEKAKLAAAPSAAPTTGSAKESAKAENTTKAANVVAHKAKR